MTGEEFKKKRIALGWKTRKWAAEDIGVKPNTIKDWELGRSRVPQYAINWLRRCEAALVSRRQMTR